MAETTQEQLPPAGEFSNIRVPRGSNLRSLCELHKS